PADTGTAPTVDLPVAMKPASPAGQAASLAVPAVGQAASLAAPAGLPASAVHPVPASEAACPTVKDPLARASTLPSFGQRDYMRRVAELGIQAAEALD